MIEAQSSYWLLDRSITWLRLTCTLADGNRTTPEAGTRRTPSLNDAFSYPEYGACNVPDGGDSNHGQYMTGVRVFDDQYAKNLRIQCGTAIVDDAARTFRISRREPGTHDILNIVVQHDDRTATLACADDEIMTGLKMRFRKDKNESAFTYFQPFCSKVSVLP